VATFEFARSFEEGRRVWRSASREHARITIDAHANAADVSEGGCMSAIGADRPGMAALERATVAHLAHANGVALGPTPVDRSQSGRLTLSIPINRAFYLSDV